MELVKKCKACGSTLLVKNGSNVDKTGKWQKYKCNECGHNQKGELLYTWVFYPKNQIKEIEYFDPDYEGGQNRIGYQCGCNKTWIHRTDAVKCIISGHKYDKSLREVRIHDEK